jgi:hypothetical protein
VNHSFITVKGSVSRGKVDLVLHEINARRFNGVFVVSRSGDSWWDVIHATAGWPYRLDVWVENNRRVEMRKALGDFGSWMQAVFQEELALVINGRCGDQGISERWDPEPGKFPTFRSYWDVLHEGFDMSPAGAAFIRGIFRVHVAAWPKDLQALAGEAP